MGVTQTPTIRISERSQSILRELASQTGRTMQEMLEKAVELYRRSYILEETSKAYQMMREDPARWNDELNERRLWETTNSDGLEGK